MRKYIDIAEGYTDDDVAARRERMRGKSLSGYAVIYRALPVAQTTFSPMAYVTTSRKFATEHADHMAAVEGEDYHVIRKIVDGRHVYEAPNPGEYFYDGPEISARTIYVARA